MTKKGYIYCCYANDSPDTIKIGKTKNITSKLESICAKERKNIIAFFTESDNMEIDLKQFDLNVKNEYPLKNQYKSRIYLGNIYTIRKIMCKLMNIKSCNTCEVDIE
jgi:hypothetical protein